MRPVFAAETAGGDAGRRRRSSPGHRHDPVDAQRRAIAAAAMVAAAEIPAVAGIGGAGIAAVNAVAAVGGAGDRAVSAVSRASGIGRAVNTVVHDRTATAVDTTNGVASIARSRL